MQSEASPPEAPSRGDPPTPTGGKRSLFDRYAPSTRSSARSTARGHSETKSSRIRHCGSKLACYLNGEVSTGRCTLVHLPDECDTLGEVLPKIQQAMHLNKKLLYAAELYLPNGERINEFRRLVEAADMSTAIIVGCGEPFDPSTVPYDLLEFHLHGGGRVGPSKVRKELADKRKRDAHDKADSVRASGHGVFPNSIASVTARSQTVALNHSVAAEMRHEYMEQLMFRSSQQKELVETVKVRVSVSLECEPTPWAYLSGGY